MDLETTISKITQYKLRDFIKYMAGGVTPKITESDQYYSNSTDGIPFLRVQNLSPAGLCWSDCKYISTETHEDLLNRSKVFAGDLLVKITGVGRMAITSIAPKNFEGNINQHMVVVKTKNPQINDQIATFLNSDIGEMLASRRSTGGTRPALDYKALRSIPIILNDTVSSIMDKAYSKKTEKDNQAEALLNSINDYLLQELGIVMPPEEEKTLESRIFHVNSSQIIGGRFDPVSYSKKSEFYKYPTSIYKWINFSNIIISAQTGLPVRQDYRAENGMHPYYGANGIIGYMDEYTHDGQYLVIGQDGYIGNHYIVNGKFWASNHNWVIKLNTNLCNYDYVKAFLDFWNYSHLVTGGVIPKLTQSSVNKIPIVLPDLKEQDKIALEIKHIYAKAKNLEQEAQNAIDVAKEQVEKILLGGSL